ncbi:MAG: YifB family Mg chelatase-like AAA ATPase [Acidimicrobiia bacterium]
MLSVVRSASVLGSRGWPVAVEVHIGVGLPTFTILGRPDDNCRESRDRIRTAVLSSGFSWPSRRITVNLAPPTRRKVGTSLDLAMALAILVADGQVAAPALAGIALIGELGLDGRVRAVAGAAPMVMSIVEPGDADEFPSMDPITSVVVPTANVDEARIAGGLGVRAATTLGELVDCLESRLPWPDVPVGERTRESPRDVPDLADVRGQDAARLGLELAAAGGHNLLLVGPPGSGKTMLARRLPGLLPPLDDRTALEAALVRSAAGEGPGGLERCPPFRMPHHSASTVSIIGGGSSTLRPGEASLAHGGVLFLDELGEFGPATLDALRQPLESGSIRIDRAQERVDLPARFTLVAATNPCPCGGGAPGSCECDDGALSRYRRRFSGPFMDRFDLRVLVRRPGVDELLGDQLGESTATVRARVDVARCVALERQGVLNARLAGDELDRHATVDASGTALLRHELESGRLTGRGLHRIRRVARTIADREQHCGSLGEGHVAAALALRSRVAPRRGDDVRNVTT